MSCCHCSNGLDVLTIAHPNTKGLDNVDAVQPKDLARIIDHTYLKPDGDRAQIEKLCAEARQYKFASVCVNTTMVHLASELLKDSGVNVCAVIGFPLGAGTTASKVFEAQEAVRCGAVEVDMVINVGALKSRDYALVEYDIRKVVQGVEGTLVKVIIETCLLTDEEKVIACALAKAAGAHFVKTSTGFSKGGATVEDVALMRRVVGPEMGVKASGGIRDAETAIAMVKAGATRLGVSASVAIVEGGKSHSNY
ncbi:MAG: deoxyribose-phosphate aldolase [Proteobacteria bacterium]|nr:deoxyribose-phosphate aldolase [Pseudomonadota bacterium]